MTRPAPQGPGASTGRGISWLVRAFMAVGGSMGLIFLLYVLTGHQPGQFFEDILNLFGAGHTCPAGEHWSSVLNKCFPNE